MIVEVVVDGGEGMLFMVTASEVTSADDVAEIPSLRLEIDSEVEVQGQRFELVSPANAARWFGLNERASFSDVFAQAAYLPGGFFEPVTIH